MDNINSVQIGRYIQQKQGYKAFTPFDFPPKDGFIISPKLYKKHEEAIRLVGKLDGITRLLPDKDFFLLMFIKKDATFSSQIEGTKATLQDAVAEPVTEEKSRLHPDVDDIVHYVDAVNYGMMGYGMMGGYGRGTNYGGMTNMMLGNSLGYGMMGNYGYGYWSFLNFLSLVLVIGLIILIYLWIIKLWKEVYKKAK